jgi:hypothetical protein
LPLPDFNRGSAYYLDASRTALIAPLDSLPVVRRDGQIYLQLYELDLDDPDAILSFANDYGVVRGSYEGGWPHFADLYRELQPAANAVRDNDAVALRLGESHVVDVCMLEIFVAAARVVRDLTTAWRVLISDPTLDPARARWESRPAMPPPSRGEALAWLATGLGGCLRGFGPRVRSPYRFEEDYEFDAQLDRALANAFPSPLGVILRPETPSATLDEVCVLELYNHIAQQEGYRRCQNETCRRAFIQQYGRSEHGLSRREGVLYCSHACAQAQASRVYRRRRKTRTAHPET